MTGGVGDQSAVAAKRARLPLRPIIEGIVRSVGVVAATLIIYGLVPINGESSARAAALTAMLGILSILVVFGRQVTRVAHHPQPILAAVEAVALVFGMFVCLFALLYVSMEEGSPGSFSAAMTKTTGIYFSTTVLATVGFGDIAPVTDTARTVVTIQMVLGMVLFGTAIKALSYSARVGVKARQPAEVAALEAELAPAGGAQAGEAPGTEDRAPSGDAGDGTSGA